jgi:Fic family protein
VGEHDRVTREPIPENITAPRGELQSLIHGLATFEDRAVAGGLDPIVTAASLAFGFVYIHPFEDGNGRIHDSRYFDSRYFNPPPVARAMESRA